MKRQNYNLLIKSLNYKIGF